MVIHGRRARKKAVTRDHLTKVATGLFGRHGIDAVTVDQIAHAADVGKGTIYNYFQTKEDIVVAFMADFEREVQAELQHFSHDGPLVNVLTEFIRLQWQLKARHHAFVRVFFAQMFLHAAEFVPYMARIHTLLAPNIEALFGSLQRRGTIRGDVSVADLTLVFAHVQFGLTAMWAIEGPPFAGAEIVMQREIALFCEGLTARAR